MTATGGEGAARGRVALVTGASRGLGQALAVRLAAEGAKVGVTSRGAAGHDLPGSLDETVAAVGAVGGEALPVVADLADPAFDAGAVVAAVEAELGPIDIVVHNAAGPRAFDVPVEAIDRATLAAAFGVNLWAAWALAGAVVPGMRERGAGWFLTISSIQAAPRVGPPYRPHPTGGAALYGATKAAIDRFTTGAAMELHPSGIAVNALAPEPSVDTPHSRTVVQHRADRVEPVETVVEAALALCTGDPHLLTGRVAYSLSLLKELGRPVRTLGGTALVEGWQPDDIPDSRLIGGYVVGRPQRTWASARPYHL